MTTTRLAPTYESVLADLTSCCGTARCSIELWSAGPELAWAGALLESPLRPGDRVLMTRAGDDSARVADLAAAHGFDVVCCDVAAGESTSLQELMHLLWWDPSIRAVVVVRDETSTGVTCDPAEVREVLELTGSDALLLVDCRASLGVSELHQDAWGADLLVATTGPGLGVPGLTVLSRSARACAGRPDGAGRPVVAADDPRLDALRAALDGTALTGLAALASHRERLAEGVRRGLTALGLVLCARHHPSDEVTVAYLPVDVDAQQFVSIAGPRLTMLDLAPESGNGAALRFCHAGMIDDTDCLAALAAVEHALVGSGASVVPGSGVGAAMASFRG